MAEHSTARQAAINSLPLDWNEAGLLIGGQSVVEYWERPIQEELARCARTAGTRIIEVGYGLGMCSNAIQSLSPDAYVLIEAHRLLADIARAKASSSVEVVNCEWIDAFPRLMSRQWDAIVFDAFPLLEQKFDGTSGSMIDLLRPAIEPASTLLELGGRLLFLDFTGDLAVSPHFKSIWAPYFGSLHACTVALTIPETCSYAQGMSGDVISLIK